MKVTDLSYSLTVTTDLMISNCLSEEQSDIMGKVDFVARLSTPFYTTTILTTSLYGMCEHIRWITYAYILNSLQYIK